MKNLVSHIGPLPVEQLAKDFGTPAFIYEKAVIEARIAELKAFEVIRFAQKACSNLAILALMRKNGVVVDAVSAGEIHRALKAGYKGHSAEGGSVPGIVFTADLFDEDAAKMIKEHRIPVNVGSPDMIAQLGKFHPGAEVTLRINPGFGHGHSRKVNTGGSYSKHGIWHADLEECLRLGAEAGVHIQGLHMHIGSGSDYHHLSTVCDAMVKAAKRMGPQLKVISAGGGLPIPYRKEQARIDIAAYHGLWDKARKAIEKEVGHPVALEVEPGRYLVAESCSLLTQIRSVKNSGGNRFYLVDAGFDTLVRPAMYGAYHEISICPADGRTVDNALDTIVAGPLCESGDVFTQEEGGVVTTRKLPEAVVGDYLILHDAGAYGAAMSSNYNTRKLAAEVLIQEHGTDVIRERQTFDAILQFERVPANLS
ncbi:MAG TPA: diaminopimelate decarboxylase [Fibrobacteria bacterium]|nr:diaminopimelate decarboxylase [Fibrobacteria bacterium]